MIQLEPSKNKPSITRQCSLLNISRSSLYYHAKGESAKNLELMRQIDKLFTKHPFYGSRQMVRSLAMQGVQVGRHRVRRLMRLMGLCTIYQKPNTSKPHPDHRIYPYLLRELTIEKANLVHGHHLYPCNLVAIMDWATRKVLMAIKQHDDGRFLCRGTQRGHRALWRAADI